jgi:hypothetical protein
MHNKCFESKQVAVPRPLIFIMISGKNTATNMRKNLFQAHLQLK